MKNKKVVISMIFILSLFLFISGSIIATNPVKTKCTQLFWFDKSSKSCGMKRFCDLYMYQGLQTFSRLSDCKKALTQKIISTSNPCSIADKKAKVCPMINKPVCGLFTNSSKCLGYPCGLDFANSCLACQNQYMIAWLPGTCPQIFP